MFKIDHVSLSVDNLEKSISFYKLFGFEVFNKYESETLDIFMLKSKQDIYIELFFNHSRKPLPETAKQTSTDLPIVGTKHFALRVDDINKAAEFVVKNKIADKIEVLTGRLGRNYFFVKDPSGILVEIIEER